MAGEQLGMVALLHDLPVVDVADLIRILDRGQAVRDDEARASLEQMVQTGLQRLFGTRVDIRRGLVENQNARVGEQHARERDELALARGQGRTALLQFGTHIFKDRIIDSDFFCNLCIYGYDTAV